MWSQRKEKRIKVMLDREFIVNSEEDMQKVELRITGLCHGEMGRCNILKSAAYARFRLDVLYGVRAARSEVNFVENRIKLVRNGNIVEVYCVLDESEFQGEADELRFSCEEGKKRGRRGSD